MYAFDKYGYVNEPQDVSGVEDGQALIVLFIRHVGVLLEAVAIMTSVRKAFGKLYFQHIMSSSTHSLAFPTLVRSRNEHRNRTARTGRILYFGNGGSRLAHAVVEYEGREHMVVVVSFCG